MTGAGFWDFAIGAPLVGAGFSFGFVVVRWAANFIAGRIDKKEAVVDAGMIKLIADLNERIDMVSKSERDTREELRKDRAEFRAYQIETDKQLSECRRKHGESEAEVMQLRSMLQGYGDARQLAQMNAAADKVGERARK